MPPDAKIHACHVCPGLAALAARHDVERIVISGRRESPDAWTWTVDVVTDIEDGHATAATLDQAVNQAVAEVV